MGLQEGWLIVQRHNGAALHPDVVKNTVTEDPNRLNLIILLMLVES